MTPTQVLWHRVWLIIAALLLVAAYINGFRISHAILSRSYRLPTVLTFAASFCIAMGMKGFAKDFFNINSLWYASFPGFMFVSSILVIFVSIFLMLAKTFVDPTIKRALYPEQMQFLLPAFAILWTVILGRSFGSVKSSHQYSSSQYASHKKSHKPSVRLRPPMKRIIRPNTSCIKKVRDKLHRRVGLLKRK